eukprot:5647955-Alexandrium_andersonii.AAC.1
MGSNKSVPALPSVSSVLGGLPSPEPPSLPLEGYRPPRTPSIGASGARVEGASLGHPEGR